jgi:glycosyltransferase involved in cell wall biosynthesis
LQTVIIFSAYLPPHSGGIETYSVNLANELVKMRIRPILVTSNYSNTTKNPVPPHETPSPENNNIEVFRLPVHKTAKNRYPVIKKNSEFRMLMQKLNETVIDDLDDTRIIVNTRFHHTSLIGARFGHKLGVPVFCIEHGSAPLTLDNLLVDVALRGVENRMTKLIKPNVTRFYAVSKSASDHIETRYQKLGIKSSGEWYNSITTDLSTLTNGQFRVLPPKPNDGIFRITYVGRVIPQKGVDLLLEAFEMVQDELQNTKKLHLDILGDGNQLGVLKERYKGNVNIKFWGRTSRSDVFDVLSKSTTTTTTTTYPEGLPTVILEAGLFNNAVIGTRVSGIVDVLKDDTKEKNEQNGILINPGSAIEIKKALVELISDNKLCEKLYTKLHEDVLQNFSWERTAQHIVSDIFMNTIPSSRK